MKSRQRRRPVRPLTIYGFRRGRPRSRRLWLALLVLASLSVLPRVLSPIAEKFWGESAHPKAPPARTAAPVVGPTIEPGNAFASSEPETVASVDADSLPSAQLPPAPEAPSVQPTTAPPARPVVHHTRAPRGKKTAHSATREQPGRGLVPAR